MPKTYVGKSFTAALISGSEKVWIGGGEYQDFPSNIFCLTLPKFSVGESFTVALVSGDEKVYGQQGKGSIKIFRRKLWSHSPESFRRGIFYSSSNVGYQKSLDKKVGVSRLSVENFLSHSAEIVVGESFFVALISGIEKAWERRGQYQDFLSEICCVTVPKFSVGESLIVALNSGTEKFWIRGGGEYQDFPSKIFVSQCRKFP